MTKGVEIIIFVISTQWRAFSAGYAYVLHLGDSRKECPAGQGTDCLNAHPSVPSLSLVIVALTHC